MKQSTGILITIFACILSYSAFFLHGCGQIQVKVPPQIESKNIAGYSIRVIDSCEYVEYDYGFANQRVFAITHKGNCKNHKK